MIPAIRPRLQSNSVYFLLAGLLTCLPGAGWAKGALDVMPKRVIFEGRLRSATVDVINRGDSTESFRVTIEDPNPATEKDTGVIALSNEPLRGAAAFLVYTPKQFTLAPGKAQSVRVALRLPAGVEAGEYRTGLFIRTLPSKTATSVESAVTEQTDNSVAMTLEALPGVRVPLFVRSGAVSAKATLADASLAPGTEPGTSLLRFHIKRDGTASVYGHIQVIPSTSGKSSKKEVLGTLKGLAVYADVAERVFEMKMPMPMPGVPVDLEFVDEAGKQLSRVSIALAASAAPVPVAPKP